MDPAVAGTPASAPPAAFEDGLGERRHTVGAGNEPLEVLRLSTELSAVSSFEFALRERASRFGTFRHDSFGRVRAVERLDKLASTLVVVSDHVRGVRLSELLEGARKRSIPLEIGAALCLIRQLVSAIATMHERVPDVCHGAIGPERIVVTPDGRLVVVEYVLGAALEQLRYSQDRYWRELRIALPRTVGLPRFDGLSDVTQVGTVALALILGRPLGSHEYPGQIGEAAAQASARSATGAPEPLDPDIRMWLLRTLQLDPRSSFISAIDAQAELEIVLADRDEAAEALALKSFLTRYASPATETKTPKPVDVVKPIETAPAPAPMASYQPVSSAHSHVVTPPVIPQAPVGSVPPVMTAPPAALPGRPVAVASASAAPAAHGPVSSTPSPAATAPTPPAPKVEIPKTSESVMHSHGPAATINERSRKPEDAHAHPRKSNIARGAEVAMGKMSWPRNWMIAAAAVALIALTTGVTLLGRWYLFPSATAAGTGTLVVGTSPEGVAVVIDGQHRGTTPLSVEGLAPGDHVLELVTETEHRRLPVRITAGGQVSQFLEMPKTAPTLGDLQVRTEPSRAKVTVDGHLFGRSPLVVKNLTPGSHTVTLENDTDSITEEVTIEPGQTASLLVPMTKPQGANVSGWISVAAPAVVQIYENQRLLGSSRIDRIMISVGRHELEIVNEALGYRATRTVEVEAGRVAGVKLEWPKGTLALNALPWAEVWVDGERIGETPIGGVTVPIGQHDVVFRHPELGERRSSVNVTTGTPARVSVDLRTK